MNKKKYIIRDPVIFKLQRNGGITRYWKALNFSKSEDLNGKVIDLDEVPEKIVIFCLMKYFPLNISRYLPLMKFFKNNVIFHSSYYRFSIQRKRVKNVVTVHDCTYEMFSSGIRRLVHIMQKFWCLKFADYIIYVSENTKKDTEYFYPFVKNKQSKVIYHGISSDFCKINISDKDELLSEVKNDIYPVIFVGSREGYKNFEFVVNALAKIDEKSLWIVGGGELSEREILHLRTKKIYYRHFNNLNDHDLNKLYNSAEYLFYPSSYEGFGLPVLEAYCSECPVIALNASSVTEIHADTSLLMSDLTIDEFIRVHKMVLKNDTLKEIINKNRNFAKDLTWAISSMKHISVYNELIK